MQINKKRKRRYGIYQGSSPLVQMFIPLSSKTQAINGGCCEVSISVATTPILQRTVAGMRAPGSLALMMKGTFDP